MPPTAWQGAEAHGMMGPPPPRTSFTVANVGWIAPLPPPPDPPGTHVALPLPPPALVIPATPPAPPLSSMFPAQAARTVAIATAAATARLEPLRLIQTRTSWSRAALRP